MKLEAFTENPQRPEPDIARCSDCNFEGTFDKFELDTEGDYESGYYEILLCPHCEDGGCVDDYSMSDERLKEWEEWHEQNN